MDSMREMTGAEPAVAVPARSVLEVAHSAFRESRHAITLILLSAAIENATTMLYQKRVVETQRKEEPGLKDKADALWGLAVYDHGTYRWLLEVKEVRDKLAHGELNSEILFPRKSNDQIQQWFLNTLSLFDLVRDPSLSQ